MSAEQVAQLEVPDVLARRRDADRGGLGDPARSARTAPRRRSVRNSPSIGLLRSRWNGDGLPRARPKLGPRRRPRRSCTRSCRPPSAPSRSGARSRSVRHSSTPAHPRVYDSGETPTGQLWSRCRFGQEARASPIACRRETAVVGRRTALRIARDVADALDTRTAPGFVHRDIKPETSSSPRTRRSWRISASPASMDSGSRRPATRAVTAGETLTHTGFRGGGTPGVHESRSGERRRVLDARTDEYALAAVVYEMLAGETPYAAGNPRRP